MRLRWRRRRRGRQIHSCPRRRLLKGTPITLDQLRPGQQASILSLSGNGVVRRRFMEMGFVRGEQVTVERVAPLGDPIEYLVKGSHLSLRRADAAQILVEAEPIETDE